jgi:hypothetical protein
MDVTNNVQRPSVVQRHTGVRLYRSLAQPISCYESEAWTIGSQDTNGMTTCEMKFMRGTARAGYTKWDHKRNEDILDEIKVKPVTYFIENYQRKWKEHVNKMNTRRVPKTNFTLSAK